MNIKRTTEQEMLKDSVEKFLQQKYDFETRRALADSALGYSAEHWASFAELGWLSVPFAQEHGGFGGTMLDIITLSEAMGKALVTEPFVASLILGGRLVELLGDARQKQDVLPALIAGDLQLALAHTERTSAGNPAAVGCTVERDGDDYLISGDKIMVLGGSAADRLLLTARSSGGERDRQGIEVFMLDREVIDNSTGSSRRSYPTIDGMHAADFYFDRLRLPATARLGDPASNIEALETVVDEALVAFSAEAIGAMEILINDTVEYAKTRKQFGTAIGKFQALQFRMVDMWLGHQQASSALYMAAQRQPEGGAAGKRSVSALKVVVSEAARFVGEQAIQIHGGMGTTDELRVGHYFKRLLCLEALLGGVDYHLDRYAMLMED